MFYLYIWLSFFVYATIPLDFVDIKILSPHIVVESRYFSDWNFVGTKIKGYHANKCFLTKTAAQALAEVQAYVELQGYSLLLFDCYRPQRAVTQFVEWTKNAEDRAMQPIFYPEEPKETLVDRGYIAAKSGHSRGSTVDVTLIHLSAAKQWQFQEEKLDCRRQTNITKTGQLDMGTIFDCFSELSHTQNPNLSSLAKQNRLLLKASMEKFGFVNYSKEWWHYTLKNEPYKDTYFDFEIE